MLQLTDLCVSYGDLSVLKSVSVNVNERSITAILGPNAAGKSTLLKTISGQLKPISGEILLNGVPIEKKPPYEIAGLGLAHVPEGRRVFPNLTVLENLEVGSYLKEPKKWRQKSLEYVFSIFPRLAERSSQKAGTLSGGEQQMLAIGRGLMLRPKLLILDEPSLGLAPIIVSEVFKLVKKINEDGVTILLVEQNASASLSVLSFGYVLNNGKIAFSGDRKQLMETPQVKEVYLSTTSVKRSCG